MRSFCHEDLLPICIPQFGCIFTLHMYAIFLSWKPAADSKCNTVILVHSLCLPQSYCIVTHLLYIYLNLDVFLHCICMRSWYRCRYYRYADQSVYHLYSVIRYQYIRVSVLPMPILCRYHLVMCPNHIVLLHSAFIYTSLFDTLPIPWV